MRATGLPRRCPATCPRIPMARAFHESSRPAGGPARRARHSRRRPGPRRRPAAARPHPGNPAACLPPGRTPVAQPGPAVPPVPADHPVPAAHRAPVTRSAPATSAPVVRPGRAARSAMVVRPARRWRPVGPPPLGQAAAARGPSHRTRAACPPPAVPQRVTGSGRPAAGTSGAEVAQMAAQRPQQPAIRTAAADLHRLPQPNIRTAADLHRPPQAAGRMAAADVRRPR
jgi:hypothetical protein